ncbi:MAG: hypothetical protein C4304_09135 [candidate division GAL15 bacterium]
MQVLGEMAGPHANRGIVELFLSVVPTFPVGIPVRILSGRWRGYSGVVVRSRRGGQLPVVHLVSGPGGSPTDPVEVDLAQDPCEVQSTVLPPHLPVAP